VHSDVWGPSPTKSIGGKQYYITFTDDYSRYTLANTLKAKSDAADAYKTFFAWAHTQHGATIRRFRSDRGGEYTSNALKAFHQQHGTEQRLTTHDTPQHNGIAESLNRRLMERVRAFLHHSGLPKSLWGEALQHAVWLKNRTSTRVLGVITPFERLYGHKPNLAGVPEWGQRVWVRNLKGSKLDARGLPARWVGYDIESPHAHRIYWPEKHPHPISVERDIKFTTDTATVHIPSSPSQPQVLTPKVQPIAVTSPQMVPQTPRPNVRIPEADPIPEMPDEDVEALDQAADDDYVIPSPITPMEATPPPLQPPPAPQKLKPMPLARPEPPRRSTRIAKLSQAGQAAPAEAAIPDTLHAHMQRALLSRQGDDSANESFTTAPEEPSYAEMAFHVEIDTTMAAAAHDANGDPRSISEVRSRPDWPEWQQAMEREIETLERAHTWETVPRPEGKNIVGSKWVFRLKRKADGSIDKYKA
jgi:hypothetical protein